MWICKKSFNEWIMGWSRSTFVGWYLFVVGWFRNHSDFFGKIVEKDAHDYMVLIVNIQESRCHLYKEMLASTNDVAKYADSWGEKIAQMIIVTWFRGVFIHLLCPLFRFNMQ